MNFISVTINEGLRNKPACINSIIKTIFTAKTNPLLNNFKTTLSKKIKCTLANRELFL